MYETHDVELNANHVNAKIHYDILTNEEMEQAGFRKTQNNSWYLCNTIQRDNFGSITFNVTLPIPHDDNLLSIDILDEEFLQPYDFQAILACNPEFEFALNISKEVENQMQRLQEAGILSGHEIGEYI